MQYCSLQHWTLLLSPVTSTAGYSFCFGSIPSFFLELFLHSSPVACPIGHLLTRGVPLSVSYHFAFSYCSWGSQGKNTEVVGHSLLHWATFCQTSDGDCSHEIKRRLLLERKVMTNLDSILKIRDITLPTKVRLVKAMVFPVVMYDVRVGL